MVIVTKDDGVKKVTIKKIETMDDILKAIDFLEEHKKLWKPAQQVATRNK